MSSDCPEDEEDVSSGPPEYEVEFIDDDEAQFPVPKLADYGITPEEFALYEWPKESLYDGSYRRYGKDRYYQEDVSCVYYAMAFITLEALGIGLVYLTTGSGEWAFGLALLGLLPAGVGATALVEWIYSRHTRAQQVRLRSSSKSALIEAYKHELASYHQHREQVRAAEEQRREVAHQAEQARREAELDNRRHAVDYWQSLSGVEFERELGILFMRMGYQVSRTPASGDHGVDLILTAKGKTAIVQCKRYAHPAGPAVVRELLGSMVAYPADYGVLACTGGFTRNVHEFVRGKRIVLMGLDDIVRMAERVRQAQQRQP